MILNEMNAQVGIRQQLQEDGTEPVVLINPISVAPSDVDAMLAAWTDDARWFQEQPGFVSTQLHRGIAGSTTFLNYAVWRSVADFRAAFTNPAFQAKLGAYPESATASPHLFRKVAVEGLCAA